MIIQSFLALFLLAAPARVQADASGEVKLRQAVEAFQQQRYGQALPLLKELSAQLPDNFDVAQLLAITLDLTGDAPGALAQFEKAARLNPDSAMARINFGTSLLRAGRLDDAVREFEAALVLDPSNVTANFNLGTVAMGRRDFAQACPLLEKAFRGNPRVYENGYQLAFCHYLAGDAGKSAQILGEIRSQAGDRLEFGLLNALALRASGQVEAGDRELEAVLPRLTKVPEAHQELAALLFSQNLFQAALPILKSATSAFPDNPTAWKNRSIAESQTGDTKAAIESALRSLALEESADVQVLLGDLYEGSGESLKAVEHFQRAVELEPTEKTYYALGYEFLSHWNWEAAREVFKSGIKVDPDSWRLWLGLGTGHLGEGQLEEATEGFLEATRLNPDETLPYRLLAQVLMPESPSFPTALGRFSTLFDRHPDDPEAMYLYAFSLAKKAEISKDPADRTEALDVLAKAKKILPNYGDLLILEGELLFDLERWSEAVLALEKGLELSPADVLAHYRLGLALQRSGNREKAREVLARYQELKKAEEEAVSKRVNETRRFIVEMKKP